MQDLREHLMRSGWDAFVTEAKHGDMSLPYSLPPDEKKQKISSFFELAGLKPRPVIKLSPSGLNGIVEIDKSYEKLFCKQAAIGEDLFDVYADALITNMHNYAFYLTPGDCATIFLTSSNSDWVGFVHVGFTNVVFEVIRLALETLNQKGDSWNAFVFRHIHKESYMHTDPFMYDNLLESKFFKYVEKVNEEKYLLNLDGAIIDQLKEKGIKNIFVDPNDNFRNSLQGKSFSHRAYRLGKQEKDYRFLVGIFHR